MPDSSNPFRIPGTDLMNTMSFTAQQGLVDSKLRDLRGLQNAQGSKGLAPGGSAQGAPTETEKAATQFEALLLHQMLKEMWNTVPKDGVLSGGNEEALYRDMLNEGIANDIAEKHSIGIKDVLVRDMKKFEKK
ncbi:MAG: rod-binding protein [Deltaproteobacteria bacterium]|nr:rod-binding protein [Deltaproteobacteria bacterium]